jgi:hypothetical protein
MEKIIACCGLNCSTCDARIATISNDDELRKTTAEKWTTMYKAEVTPEMINCTGCREEGVKLAHATVCEIKKCADSKGFKTCGECKDVETCLLVSPVHKYAPDALANLRSLN